MSSTKPVLDDGRARFDKALGHLKEQLKKIRTGRASSALVDGLRVDYYGTMTPIGQMAQISIPEPRQILAGISEHYAPEDLVGKQVVIVANLKPRKLMGLESQGMVLAASDDGGLSVLLVDREVEPGSRAK